MTKSRDVDTNISFTFLKFDYRQYKQYYNNAESTMATQTVQWKYEQYYRNTDSTIAI